MEGWAYVTVANQGRSKAWQEGREGRHRKWNDEGQEGRHTEAIREREQEDEIMLVAFGYFLEKDYKEKKKVLMSSHIVCVCVLVSKMLIRYRLDQRRNLLTDSI